MKSQLIYLHNLCGFNLIKSIKITHGCYYSLYKSILFYAKQFKQCSLCFKMSADLVTFRAFLAGKRVTKVTADQDLFKSS